MNSSFGVLGANIPAVIRGLIAFAWYGIQTYLAANAVMPELQAAFGWPPTAVGTLTSAVQLGFIAGALLFALLDRKSVV